MDFNLSIPVKVVSGRGAVKNNALLLRDIGKKCIIVTGKSGASLSGALSDIKDALKICSIEYVIFNKIGANPLIEDCHEAAKQAADFGADFVIGIGGGSALDAAKAVAVYATNPSFAPFDIYESDNHNTALPIVLVGTTAGTGSEVGRIAVLSNKKDSRKKSIAFDDCMPTLSFADSAYTRTMPYDVTVSTALDALSHAIEGYYSKKCTDIPTMFAEKAIPMIWEGLKYLYDNKSVPDYEGREKLYYGSLYAGITLSYCGSAFPHPLSYILTENFDVPHGKACAAFMPTLIHRGMRFEMSKTRKLFNLMKTNYEDFITTIKELADVSGIEMTKDEIEVWSDRWSSTLMNFVYSPGGFTKDLAKQTLEQLFVK